MTSEERETFVARTSAGVPIQTFGSRAQALAWADAFGDLFPGWTIACETTTVIVRTRILRRDRSHLQRIA